MQKTDLRNFNLQQLTDFIGREFNLPPFRAKQIFAWIYRPEFTDFTQMTDLSKEARALLNERTFLSSFMGIKKEISEDGTIKFGFTLDDGLLIEAVFIPEEDRNTLCVSSQAGCAMDCKFCLTGGLGFKRNLTPAEIVNQVCTVIEQVCDHENMGKSAPKSSCINNIVFMGMGEPLANFDNLITALEILMDQRGLDFSGRRLTVSTCGLVPRMHELGERVPVNLAVSLHSVNNKVRSALMPINKKYPVEVLLKACRDFPLPRRRMIMFEYIMIKGLNDSVADAHELARMIKDIHCKINLLPYNESPASDYKCPTRQDTERFQKILRDAGFSVFIRSSRGADISAACGQLAGKENDAG